MVIAARKRLIWKQNDTNFKIETQFLSLTEPFFKILRLNKMAANQNQHNDFSKNFARLRLLKKKIKKSSTKEN